MRIARPLLLVTTPIGVVAGLREAWRFHWWLALLMAALIAVLAAFFLYTWRRIRRESG
jgi:membrane protein implicated in regulation of membrane protease activity